MNFQLDPTVTTPKVQVNSHGEVTISGRSSPENSVGFYSPILEAIENISAAPRLVFNFALEYFNTSSGKCLYDLIKRASEYNDEGKEIEINWFYDPEDEDMKELGEDYEDLLDMEFNYLQLTA